MSSPRSNPLTERKLTSVLLRLSFGFAVNAILLLMLPRLGVWSSDEREFRLAFPASVIGAAGAVALLPVLLRGSGWQRVFGVLLLIVPSLSFWLVFDLLVRYR